MFRGQNREKAPAKIKSDVIFSSHFFYAIILFENRGDKVIHKNRHGQALVEFVILLPIFIFMLFAIIDFGKILLTQNSLESKMDDVITLYENDKDTEEIATKLNLEKEKISLENTTENKYTNFMLKKEVEIITPGLNLIFGKSYQASVKRVIYHE